MSATCKIPVIFILALIVLLLAAPVQADTPCQYSGCDQPDPEQAYYEGAYDACYYFAGMARLTRNEAELTCAYLVDKAKKSEWYEQGRGWKRLERAPVGWGA